MKEIVIDCTQITCREDLHRIFSQALSFPAWYGHNLDALQDCLMSLSIPTSVRLLDWDAAEVHLGKYGLSAKKVIARSALENPYLEVILS